MDRNIDIWITPEGIRIQASTEGDRFGCSVVDKTFELSEWDKVVEFVRSLIDKNPQ